MSKRLFILLPTLLLTSCGGIVTSSDTSLPSSEAASSRQDSSSNSPLTSEEGVTSEESSEELSESSLPSESSLTSEEEKKEDIYLHYGSSRLFVLNADPTKSPGLKTYRHSGFGSVPFVDLQEFASICYFLDASLEYRLIFEVEKDKYLLRREDGSGILFDAVKQKVKLVNGFIFFGDMGHENNGVPQDMMLGINLVRPSKKTKILSQGEEKVYDLNAYHLPIISLHHHLYVPFGLVNTLLIEPFFTSFTYNGRDFYSYKALSSNNVSTRARSRAGSFSWTLNGGSNGETAIMRKVDPKSDESYRFEGETKGTNKSSKVAFSLKQNGVFAIESAHASLAMMDEGTWSKMGDFLRIHLDDVSVRDFEIDLSERSFYGLNERPQEIIDYNYNVLCLSFDTLYGLKGYRRINTFNEFFQANGLKEGLLSKNIDTYDKTMTRFLLHDIDDNHTFFTASSFFGDCSFNPAAQEDASSYYGPRYYALNSGRAELATLFNEAVSAGTADIGMTYRGETAFITINHCNMKLEEKGYQTYTLPEGMDISNAINAFDAQSYFRVMSLGMNEVLKHSEIKNVVLDLSMNTGGYVYNLPLFCAFLSKDPTIVMTNMMTNTTVEYHYEVDLNGDGKFADEGDSFEGKYNFYVLTGPSSFSAGNITPALAKSNKLAKIIGLPTAGGPCASAARTDTFGYMYITSGELHWPCIVDGQYLSNDEGVPLDITLEKKDLYNFTKIAQMISAK